MMEYGALEPTESESEPAPKQVLEIHSADPVKIGYALRQKRESMGLSGTAVARMAGISQAQLSRLENGRQGFRAARLDMLARALGILVVVHYGE